MRNIRVKTKRNSDCLTPTDVSLAYRSASKLEEYLHEGGHLNKEMWCCCGWSVAKATRTAGGLFTSVVGLREHFKDNPFGSEEGKVGSCFKLR